MRYRQAESIGNGRWRIQRRYLAGALHYFERQLGHHRIEIFQEEYLAFPKSHGAHYDEKYQWDQLRWIIPCPTGRFFRGMLSQALRAWLRSYCPSGTKAIRPSKGLSLS